MQLTMRSLPVRERGLKPLCLAGYCRGRASLPVRERGLKPPFADVFWWDQGSLPVRERGLKLLLAPPWASSRGRSPCGSVD